MKANEFKVYWVWAALVGVGMAAVASRAVAAVTLRAGNVSSVAGTTALVPITLDAGSVQVSLLQFNVTVVAHGGAPAITDRLTYQSAIGTPGIIDSGTPGSLLVGYLTLSSGPLTGMFSIGTLGVPIPAGATGTYELQVLNASALDPSDDDIPITGASGMITILVVPTPTPTPSCPGDCRGDGEVTVADLVQGVDIALGTAGASECLVFDRDRDGAVTIDELVKAVAAALDGCASALR